MGRKIKKRFYLSEISSMRELREARGELEIREWFARERLLDDAAAVLSIGTLVSMLTPRGSLVGRILGGIGGGFSAAFGSLRGRGGSCGCRREEHPAAGHEHHAGHHHAEHAAGLSTRSARAKVAPSRAIRVAGIIRKDASVGLAAASPKPKRSPEIVVEVDLDAPKGVPKPKRSPEIVVEVDLDAPKGKPTAPKTHTKEAAMAVPKPKRSPEIVAEVELE